MWTGDIWLLLYLVGEGDVVEEYQPVNLQCGTS